MWVNREEYAELKCKLEKSEEWRVGAEKSRDLYSEKLGKVKAELGELKRSLMPTKHYIVIDTNSGLRYDVDAVDYLYNNTSYDDESYYVFRKADYSEVFRIHKYISIQVVEEE